MYVQASYCQMNQGVLMLDLINSNLLKKQKTATAKAKLL